MDQIHQHIANAKATLAGTLSQLYAQLDGQIPKSSENAFRQYFDAVSGTTQEQLLGDLRLLKITPATVTLALISVPTLYLASLLFSTGTKQQQGAKKSKSKKKKQSKAQKANVEIQRILDFVEETYVPQIDSYIENYASLSEEDKLYKYKYFEEMLLKELMNLDDVDVLGSDVLRDNRKKVIRFIQDHQRRLDLFKKEN